MIIVSRISLVFFRCPRDWLGFVLTMDVLPSGNIFHELQVVHDTGYFDGKVSPEEHWQQVRQQRRQRRQPLIHLPEVDASTMGT